MASTGLRNDHAVVKPQFLVTVENDDSHLLELEVPANGQVTRSTELMRPKLNYEEAGCPATSYSRDSFPTVVNTQDLRTCQDEYGRCGLRCPDSSRSLSHAGTPTPTSPLPQEPRRRRWSTGAFRKDMRSSSITSTGLSEPPLVASPRQWCEEFCREWTKGFSQTYWQPLSDFNYVMQIYYHLTEVQNHRLFPELTVRYLSWMTPEQTKIQRDWCLSLEGENQSSVVRLRGNSSSGHGRVTDVLGITGSRYPLTACQLFKVARVCNDAEWAVRLLLEGLNEFKYCRAAYLWAGERRRNHLRPHLARKCIQATKECLDMSKCLVARLKVSPTLLCEFMGLDPAKVPSCHYPGRSNMSSHVSGAVVTQEGRVPREQGEQKLPRSFGFQQFSLQIGHIALEVNYHAPFLPRGATKSVSRRMLARSETLADEARKAGEWRTEAKMRCLRKKIRCVSERTEKNSFPETIRLLDSVTRPAVLAPQSGAGVKTHGELGRLPLETLLGNLDSLLAPETRPASSLGAESNKDLAGPSTGCKPGTEGSPPESAA